MLEVPSVSMGGAMIKVIFWGTVTLSVLTVRFTTFVFKPDFTFQYSKKRYGQVKLSKVLH